MQFQATLSESPPQDLTDFAGLLLRMTMYESIIRVATPRDCGEMPGQPGIEHVVHEHVAQQWADHSSYTKGNFQFERVIVGWRVGPVLDLRRKR